MLKLGDNLTTEEVTRIQALSLGDKTKEMMALEEGVSAQLTEPQRNLLKSKLVSIYAHPERFDKLPTLDSIKAFRSRPFPSPNTEGPR